MVYDDADKLYAEVREVCTGLLEDAFSVLLPRSSPLLSNSTSETLVAFNATSFARHDVIKVPLSRNAARMKAQVIQTSADGKYGYALMHSVGNKVASQPVGMFSVCMPASGVSDVFRTSVSVLNVCYSVYEWNGPLRPQERQCAAHHLRGTNQQPD
jgi:alpha-mannosidase